MSDNLATPFDSRFGHFDIADLGANLGLGTECVDTENTAWMLLTPASTPALDPTAWLSYNEPSPHGALGNNLVSQDSHDSQELALAQAAQVPQVPQVHQASQVRVPFALRRVLLMPCYLICALCAVSAVAGGAARISPGAA
jgi:hypothetical protein